ncbi:MAG: FAD-dependent oxidoreductase [Candidatus Heimdallarchaeota archaeon]
MIKESPQIGVFLCSCSGDISQRIDFNSLTKKIKELPNIAFATTHSLFCSKEGQTIIKEKIREGEINRVLVAACSPRKFERVLRRSFEEDGHNKSFFELTNIREQAAWVHSNLDEATQKALVLIAMSAVRLSYALPSLIIPFDVNQGILVVGGGVAGMQAARDLADLGHQVTLVEKEPKLGGRAAELNVTHPTASCGICCIHSCIDCVLVPSAEEILHHPGIEVKLNSQAKALSGRFGRYSAIISSNGRKQHQEERLVVGAVILATGADVFDPATITELKYGKSKNVVTSLEMARFLGRSGPFRRPSDGKTPRVVTFALCVGSRSLNPRLGNSYCSLVCCSYAVGQAIKIKETNPEIEVFIHYIDLRSPYRGFEEYVLQAKQLGVKFIRGRVAQVQETDQSLQLRGMDTVLGKLLEYQTDLVILFVGMVPSEGTKSLAASLCRPVENDGFPREISVNLAGDRRIRSKDHDPGLLVVGGAQGPRGIRHSIADARSASFLVADLLKSETLALSRVKAEVLVDACDGCGNCIPSCPFDALKLMNDRGKPIVKVEASYCEGCGICYATCPKSAIEVHDFRPAQFSAVIRTALAHAVSGPLILAFCCNWCGYSAADSAGIAQAEYPPNIVVVRVMCAGMVRPSMVFDVLLKGVDGVLIFGCPENDCHYIKGSVSASEKQNELSILLDSIRLDPARIQFHEVHAGDWISFVTLVTKAVTQFYLLGPIKTSRRKWAPNLQQL